MKICVIGAGPAGLMASLQASQHHEVIVIDSMPQVGTKLLMTGNGRCNVTNNRSVQDFLACCSKSSKFMYSSLTEFGPREIISFFEKRGVKLHEEDDFRMFPNSNQAEDILKALLQNNHSTFMLGSYAQSFHIKDNTILALKTLDQVIEADHFILCTGGKSFPATGSDGSGYKLAKQCGHKITKLVGVEVALLTPGTEKLMGISLTTRVQVLVDKKVRFDETGDLLYTHFGLSGPVILKASESVVDALEKKKDVVVRVQLGNPSLEQGSLKKELSAYVPKRMVDHLLKEWREISHLEQVSKAEKDSIRNTLFTLDYSVTGTLPMEKAFVTRGGIPTNEVNPKTMQSKRIDNISICGEILDVHGMLGGFNITLALSSGYTAGTKIDFLTSGR